LSGVDAERRFPDAQKALDCARNLSEIEAVTIEVWQDGQYSCCVPRRPGEADFPSIGGPSIVPNHWLMAAERYANRAARALMATAGPLFWLCIVVLILAASFAWQVSPQ
jgi:hypothetical protein